MTGHRESLSPARRPNIGCTGALTFYMVSASW
jgi:hypothetical protein